MNKIIRLIIAIVCGYIAAVLLRHIIPIRILFYPAFILVAWGVWTNVPKFIPALKTPLNAAGKPVDVVEDGDWTIIKATPAPLPIVRFSILSAFVGLCVAFLAMMIGGGNNPSSGAVFTGLLVGVIAAVLIFFWRRLPTTSVVVFKADRLQCVLMPFACQRVQWWAAPTCIAFLSPTRLMMRTS